MFPTNDPAYKKRRRSLRRNQTKAELVLWQELRARKTRHKWRRQFGIDTFIVDFCCVRFKLIIELDGPIHRHQQVYDNSRENCLRRKGYTLLRFSNDEVLFQRDAVMEKIKKNNFNPD